MSTSKADSGRSLADIPPSIGKPAATALAALEANSLGEVSQFTEAELLATHGIGPKAIRILKEVLAQRNIDFKAN